MLLALLPLLLPAPAQAVAATGTTMCTMEYRPVCAVLDGRRRTFPNRCAAREAGARRIAPGACRRR